MTQPDARSLILHQYDTSPFSEKVRVILGIKALSWFACNQPSIMPKDDLVALTGGYRRIPVLQIGADLYFDSLFIIEELERRFPDPSAFRGIGRGLGVGLAQWSDSWAPDSLFLSIVGLLFGGDLEVPPEFLEDRTKMSGAPFDPKAMRAAAPQLAFQVRRHLELLEDQLSDGRAFLTGDQADIADAAFYFHVWFMRAGRGETARLLDAWPRLLAWEKRVAALGHGKRGETDALTAIEVARKTDPAALVFEHAPAPGDPAPGERATIRYFDANTPPLEGFMLGSTTKHVSVLYESPQAGALHLHIPRSVGGIVR